MSFANGGSGRTRRRIRWVLAGFLGLALTASVTAQAGSPGHATKKKRPAAKGRKTSAPAASSTFLFSKPKNVVPNQQGKIVVFSFRNDEGDELSTQVGHLLEARGLELLPGVRPVDTADQFRDVATHLDLVAYVDGEVRGTEAKLKVTVRVRNGFTGRHVSQAVFTEPRPDMARELSDHLWAKLAPALAHACSDASRPRKASRNTLQINAGVPLTASE
ncbi:MAG TPA: hypothetical protein VGP07_25360 [Polyangia bacterium]